MLRVDRQGNARPLIGERQNFEEPRLSPDGKRIGVRIEDAGKWDVWVYDIDRGTRTRLTVEGSDNRGPLWSPDGTRITFASRRSGSLNLYWKMADGSGEAQPLLEHSGRQSPDSWSPDGRLLAFSSSRSVEERDIWVLPMEGERTPMEFLATSFNEHHSAFSPDGHWLAYVSDESGRNAVYVQPYPGPGRRVAISPSGGDVPHWSPDGTEIFYRNGDQMLAVSVETEPAFTARKPRLLFEGRYETDYDVSTDGRHFVMIRTEYASSPTEIRVVLNWFDELERLVPVQ